MKQSTLGRINTVRLFSSAFSPLPSAPLRDVVSWIREINSPKTKENLDDPDNVLVLLLFVLTGGDQHIWKISEMLISNAFHYDLSKRPQTPEKRWQCGQSQPSLYPGSGNKFPIQHIPSFSFDHRVQIGEKSPHSVVQWRVNIALRGRDSECKWSRVRETRYFVTAMFSLPASA